MNTLTAIMQAFQAAFAAGTAAVTPAAQGLYAALIGIDFAWAAAKCALDGGGGLPKLLVEKAMRYGIFGYFIANYSSIFHSIVDSCIQVGLTAGGGGMSPANFADPSWLIDKGLVTVEPIEKFIKETNKFAINLIGLLLLLAIVYAFIVAAYFIMAIQVFITYLEVYVVGTLALVFLGCGVNKHTAFLAEKSIGAVLSFAIKLMTLAFIITVANPILDTLVAPEKADMFEYLKLLGGVASIAFLCWQAPSLAAGLMAGSPSLSVGGVAGAVMSAGAAAVGGAMAARGVASLGQQAVSALSGAGAGAQATMAAAQAATAAAGGVKSGVLDTGGAGIANSFGGSSANASGSGSGITSEGVARKFNPVSNSSPPMSASGSDTGGSSGLYMPDGSWHSVGGDASPGTGSNEAMPGASNAGSSGSTTGFTGISSSAAAPTGEAISAPSQAEGKPQESVTTAAKLASRIALVNNAIPPESSPQGGVGVSLRHDE